MKKLYDISNIFHIYFVDIDNQNKRYDIKTFSKEWWKLIWNLRLKFRIKIETYK